MKARAHSRLPTIGRDGILLPNEVIVLALLNNLFEVDEDPGSDRKRRSKRRFRSQKLHAVPLESILTNALSIGK